MSPVLRLKQSRCLPLAREKRGPTVPAVQECGCPPPAKEKRGTYRTRGPGMWVPVAPAAGQGEAGTYRTRGPGMRVPAAGQGEAGDLPYPRFTNAGARLRPRRSGDLPYPRSRNSLRNEALQGDQGRVLFSWT